MAQRTVKPATYEPEIHLAEDVIVPDLAGWRRERMPVLPDAAYIETAPDWICEVLDRSDKMTIYAREKVAHAWLIDPVEKTLEVFRLDGATYRVLKVWRDEAVVRAEPFEAIELDLAVWWAS